MAEQPQQQHDVPRDTLCPPHKQYDIMDVNKKVDIVNLQCPNESRILRNILYNHTLRLVMAGSASVPSIYIQQFWHTLKQNDSKDKLKFFLDTEEFQFSVVNLKRIFQLPQATDNNNVGSVAALRFSLMLPFFTNDLGFSLILRLPSHFVSKGLSQPLHEHHHRVKSDEIFKSILSSGKNKEGAGMKIPEWMLTEEMKLTDNYRMYAIIFRDAFMDDVLNSQEDLGTRIEPRSDKESPEMKKDAGMAARDEFELRRRERGKGIEDIKDTPLPTLIRSPRTYIALISLDKEILYELTVTTKDAPSSVDKEKLKKLTVTDPTPSSSSPKPKTSRFKCSKNHIKHMGGRYDFLFEHLNKSFMPRKSFTELAAMLHSTLKEVLPSMAKDLAALIAVQREHQNIHAKISLQMNDVIANNIPSLVDSFLRNYMSNNILHVRLLKIFNVVRTRDHEDHQDNDTRPKGENSAKRQKIKYYVIDVDEVPTEEVSQELMEEISEEINEAQLEKAIDEMLRQRYKSGKKHQYHVD
ncbi:hypothetical protein Tco_0222727 [Tanacetum coccineum]